VRDELRRNAMLGSPRVGLYIMGSKGLTCESILGGRNWSRPDLYPQRPRKRGETNESAANKKRN